MIAAHDPDADDADAQWTLRVGCRLLRHIAISSLPRPSHP
jgi:hypothetical protein